MDIKTCTDRADYHQVVHMCRHTPELETLCPTFATLSTRVNTRMPSLQSMQTYSGTRNSRVRIQMFQMFSLLIHVINALCFQRTFKPLARS